MDDDKILQKGGDERDIEQYSERNGADKLMHRDGCLCCPGSEDILSLDTVLYQGFGGYTVTRNDITVYCPSSDLEWQQYDTLQVWENIAEKDVENPVYKVILDNPLRGAIWERKGKDNWVLIDTNQGFA